MKRFITGALCAAAVFFAFNSRPAKADPPLQVPINSCAGATVTGAHNKYWSNTSTTQIRLFEGIRYAQSPAGANRWKAPKANCWSGDVSATSFGSICPQGASTNEDCLFLNVYTPWTDTADLPIMVYIHGGALQGGSGTFFTDPTDLVSQGVIVVTINYRLGALGFLAHAALDNPALKNTGNYGILDQQLALKWVKSNIAQFGGNPTNVTIFGQSAGGLSVLTHLVSPLSKGLFQKAIIESGALYFQPTTLSDAETNSGPAFATALSCNNPSNAQTATCLRNAPVATILANQSSILGASTKLLKVDNVVLKDTLRNLLMNGQFPKIPVMNGSNSTEQRFNTAQNSFGTGHSSGGPIACNFVSDLVPDSEAGSFTGAMTFHTALGSGHGNFNGSQVSAIESGPYYTARSTENDVNVQFTQVMTDVQFACRGFRTSKWLAQGGAKVWYYEFGDQGAPLTQTGPYKLHDNTIFPQGAYHGAESQYLFPMGSTQVCGAPYTGLNVHQKALAKDLVAYWTNFAKTGNPSSKTSTVVPPIWPRYDGTGNGYLMQMILNKPAKTQAQTFDTIHHCSAFWDGNSQ